MSEKKTAITAEEARTLLVRAVEEKGADYVYPHVDADDPEYHGPCLYIRHGLPDCIIGHVLYYLDVPTYAIRECEGGGAATTVKRFFPDTDAYVLNALDTAQSSQDQGETWGQALEAFDKAVAAFTVSV